MSLNIRINMFEYLSTVTIQYVSAQKNPQDSSLFEVTFYLQLLKTIFTFLTQFLSRYTRVIKIHDTQPYLVCPIAEYWLAISLLRNSRYIKRYGFIFHQFTKQRWNFWFSSLQLFMHKVSTRIDSFEHVYPSNQIFSMNMEI